MTSQPSLSDWYEKPAGQDADILEEAFQEAAERFSTRLSRDKRKVDYVNGQITMQDVQEAVSKSMLKYEASQRDMPAKLWLQSFSHRVQFYGDILDVMVQHHPEYVSLAWGAMKFFFTAVINHEKVVTRLAEGLSQIGDALPQVELCAVLYPTALMKTAVAELYAYILKFLVRARDWYEEGRIKHFIHSITRPWELRYEDILEHVKRRAQVVKDLAVSGQHAEFRDTNQKRSSEFKEIQERFEKTNRKLEEISTVLAVQSAAMVDTNCRLSDLQFSQIMASLSEVQLWDPLKVYQYHYAIHRRRRPQISRLSDRFWHSAKLKNWTTSSQSAVSVVTGNFGSRLALRGLCVDVIEQLQEHQVPVVLSIRVTDDSSTNTKVSSVDLLKYFVKQALQINQNIRTEKSMALSCARFHSATHEVEWFQVLESVLAEIGRTVYIIVDLEVLDSDFDTVERFSWLSAFLTFFTKLADRQAATQVKVLLISYGSRLPFRLLDSEYLDYVVQARMVITTARQRRVGRPLAAEAKRNLIGGLREQLSIRSTPRVSKGRQGPSFLSGGVVYQLHGPGHRGDPIADDRLDELKRDIRLFKELGLNTIFIYKVEHAKSHDTAMALLAEAGISVLADLSSNTNTINGSEPLGSYKATLLRHYFDTIDCLAPYPNTLGVLVGNSVINRPSSTAAAAILRAVTRDVKRYMAIAADIASQRVLPIGYSASFDPMQLLITLQYLSAGPVEESIDFYCVRYLFGNYSWVGESSMKISGYQDMLGRFSDAHVPVFFSEYGASPPEYPRLFRETPAIYNKEMTTVFSGGIAYEFYEGRNRYGLVTQDGDSIIKLDDFHRLKDGLGQSGEEPETLLEWTGDEYTAASRPQFPEVSSRWATGPELPPSPVDWSEVISRVRDKVSRLAGTDIEGEVSSLPDHVTSLTLKTGERN